MTPTTVTTAPCAPATLQWAHGHTWHRPINRITSKVSNNNNKVNNIYSIYLITSTASQYLQYLESHSITAAGVHKAATSLWGRQRAQGSSGHWSPARQGSGWPLIGGNTVCTGATWTLYIVYIALMLLSNNNSVRKCYGTTAFKNIYVPRSTIFNCDRI